MSSFKKNPLRLRSKPGILYIYYIELLEILTSKYTKKQTITSA